MTYEELRELDAWIAEHLFGYVWVRFVEGDPWVGRRALETPELLKRSKLCVPATGEEPLAPIWYDWKTFSNDPGAAMLVLEKCAKKCDQISIVECGSWAITLGDGNDACAVSAEGETLPLAIALFAKQLFAKP